MSSGSRKSMVAVSNSARPQASPAPIRASVIDSSQINAEIETMERLGLDELRLRWRNRWGRLAPAHLSRGLLFRLMAYRLQADAFGDLDRPTAKLLDRLAARETEDDRLGATAAADASKRSPQSELKGLRPESPLLLKPGALLTREWRGRIERVMALDEGFAWNGKTYASLSAVAFDITGVKWSGRRFFFGANGRGGGGRDDVKASGVGRKLRRDPTSSAEAAP
jgi:Protein of unknown function (DUF2924)